ncbi:hypothetical protein JKF63_01876 [Porcisia hertigi]|uniref:Uncharacterized protein n=1 Tax=Porcisia hertigi TaxID=2761500 RepID=A0A836HX05_9TRYP|nr:hypothetical protein JKF63_01876 [Porcisia hertigi]
MAGVVAACQKRLLVVREPRARAAVVSMCCVLVLIAISLLYCYVYPSAKDTRRTRGRSGRRSKDKRGHTSRHGSGRESAGSGTSSKQRKTDASLPTLLMLIGIHGSGKSFWAQRYTELVHTSYVVVSSDAIRSRLTGTVSNYTRENEVEEELLKEVARTLGLRRSCIVDDCQHNLSPEFRGKLKALAPDGEVNRVVKIVSAKPSYAMVRIEGDVSEGVARYVPTMEELEKQVERVAEFERTHREDGWVKN